MRALWLNPSFLDYRVAVYRELDSLLNNQLTVIYSKERVPERVVKKAESALGPRAIGLEGERSFVLGRRKSEMANTKIRIPYQPGLLSAALKTPADVVIGEGFFQWSPAALLKSRMQKIPLVISYEKTHHTERNCPRWRSGYRKLVARFVDIVLCSGLECRRYVDSLGVPASRTIIGQMAADTEGLASQVRGISDGEKEAHRRELKAAGVVFLFAGRLIDLKGVSQLLSAWKLLEQARPGDCSLVIVGEGLQRRSLEAQIADDELRNVHLVGHVDYDSIVNYYAIADVFVFPTLEDNWALVVPEAMACGLPVICSKYTGSAHELVRPGENGWVFDPLDVKGSLDTLLECLDSRALLPEMGERSRRIVAEQSPDKAALAILEGLEMALENRGKVH